MPAAILAGAGAVWLAAHGGADRPTEPGSYLTLLVGASLIGSGLASWQARADNRLASLMVLTGFAWFAGLLSEAMFGTVTVLVPAGVQFDVEGSAGFASQVIEPASRRPPAGAPRLRIRASGPGGTLYVRAPEHD